MLFIIRSVMFGCIKFSFSHIQFCVGDDGGKLVGHYNCRHSSFSSCISLTIFDVLANILSTIYCAAVLGDEGSGGSEIDVEFP